MAATARLMPTRKSSSKSSPRTRPRTTTSARAAPAMIVKRTVSWSSWRVSGVFSCWTWLSIPEICAQLGADSLAYLSLDGLIRSTRRGPGSFCKGCFSGQYPVEIELVDKEAFELR